MIERKLYEALAESVGPMQHLPNNGAAYHTGEQVITHLNRVLGPDGWSFQIIDQGVEEDSDECWVFAQISATMNGVMVVKQDYGSQAMKRAKATGKYVSKWNDKKAAATDALKRCARLLGVGLDAWAKEGAPSWLPDLRANAEADYATAAATAIDMGHPSADKLKATDPDSLSDEVLATSTRKLEAWIEANKKPVAA